MIVRHASFLTFVLLGLSGAASAQPVGVEHPAHYEGQERKYFVGNATSFYPPVEIVSTAPPEVTAEIKALITDFAARWSAETWTTIPEFFDPDDETPYILLAHQPDWLIGWDQINGYFSKDQTMPIKDIPDEAPPGMRQIERSHYEYRSEPDLNVMLYTADRMAVRKIDDDLAMAIWYVDFQFKPRFMAAKGEHFKANAMFRNTKDGWKFIHYGEAPMSAIMYMERLYRGQVSQEFLNLLAQQEGPPTGRPPGM